MLFSVASAKSILFLCAQSTVLANPVIITDNPAFNLPTPETDDVLMAGPLERPVDPKYHLSIRRDVADIEARAASITSDQQEGLRLHNIARAGRGLRALLWDSNLEADALDWAQTMAQSGEFEHSKNSQRPGQGENLAFQNSSRPIKTPITTGTKLWIAEEKNYNNELIPDGPFDEYGHYTQCLWNTSTRVGIATAFDGVSAWYTVARYTPPGNIVGRRPY